MSPLMAMDEEESSRVPLSTCRFPSRLRVVARSFRSPPAWAREFSARLTVLAEILRSPPSPSTAISFAPCSRVMLLSAMRLISGMLSSIPSCTVMLSVLTVSDAPIVRVWSPWPLRESAEIATVPFRASVSSAPKDGVKPS